MSLHKKYQRSSCVFYKTLHFKITMCSHKKHFNSSNYKTSLYNLFACLYTKKYQRSSCVFPQNTPFQNPHEFSQQNTSIRVTIKPVYTTYLCVFTQKNTKDPHVFFHKTLHFKILMCSHNKTLQFE